MAEAERWVAVAEGWAAVPRQRDGWVRDEQRVRVMREEGRKRG